MLKVIDMRLRPIHLAVILLVSVAVALACGTPVIPPADTALPSKSRPPAADLSARSHPQPSHSPRALVEPVDHSALGVEAHVDLHVTRALDNEATSDARLLAAFRAAGASEAQIRRWRREMEESRNRDAEHLRRLLTDVLVR